MKLCEPKAEDEENTIGINLTSEMTPDMVVEKILDMVN